MTLLYNFSGLILFLIIAWLFSENRKKFPWKFVAFGFFGQFILLFLLYKFPIFISFLNNLNSIAQDILDASKAGAKFIFGNVMDQQKPAFFITLITNLVFISSLIALFYHLRIIPWIILNLSKITMRFLKLSGCEAVAAISNIFLGMAESNILLKNYLNEIPRSALMLLLSVGFATISGALLIVYSSLGMNISDLILASIISIPSAIIYSRILVPQVETESISNDINKVHFEKKESFFSVINASALHGLKMAFNILALFLVIISFIALVNIFIGKIGNIFDLQISLEKILSFIGYPIALLLGIPSNEAQKIGELLSTKVVFNEFIAYVKLSELKSSISSRSFQIATFALCSFSNLGSVAIQMASISTLAPDRKNETAQLVLKAMLAGLLASFSTAILISIII